MLLDTSGLLCLHYPAEPLHTQACVAYQQTQQCLTHSYVIAEYVALANARRFPRPLVLDLICDLLNNPDIEVIWVNETLNRAAIELLHRR